MAVHQFSLTIDSEKGDIRTAREFAVRASCHLFSDLDEGLVGLLVSELLGNAVALDAGPVKVCVRPIEGRLRIEVQDDGWGDVELVEPVEDGEGTTGRGLLIVQRMATDWGVEQFPPGKIVWFEMTPRSHPRLHTESCFVSSEQ